MSNCSECGRVNGNGEVGTSWVCEDCKVGEYTEAAKQELESNEPDGDSDDA